MRKGKVDWQSSFLYCVFFPAGKKRNAIFSLAKVVIGKVSTVFRWKNVADGEYKIPHACIDVRDEC